MRAADKPVASTGLKGASGAANAHAAVRSEGPGTDGVRRRAGQPRRCADARLTRGLHGLVFVRDQDVAGARKGEGWVEGLAGGRQFALERGSWSLIRENVALFKAKSKN